MIRNELLAFEPKQYVATITARLGSFNVYETGDQRYYLFRLLRPDGTETEVSFPVRKRDLRPEVGRMLARGVGSAT